MNEILNPKINEYLISLIPMRDEVLAEMEQYGAKNNFPLIGPLCGMFLQQMALIKSAKYIFEMGSGFGYSAIWFARGLPEDGKVICTDGDPANRKRALEYFKRAGVAEKIEFHVGNAQEIIQQFDGPFDIIFNDIDKQDYYQVIDLAIPRLRQKGILITDNALWDGKVVESPDDIYTEGVQRYNKLIYKNKDLLTTIVPLRDGLAMSVKL
ncbi:O-methyltransferase [candidate division KSB1 bacterium]|nr:O-methyltransferase [candidate division KSB1 bacterium]